MALSMCLGCGLEFAGDVCLHLVWYVVEHVCTGHPSVRKLETPPFGYHLSPQKQLLQ